MALLAGFSGRLTAFHALLLAIEGVVILGLWLERDVDLEHAGIPLAAPLAPPPTPASRFPQLILAIVLSVAGGFLATPAILALGAPLRPLSDGMLTATLLSPILVFPMIGAGTRQAARGLPWAATSEQVALVLLNLCLLLPVVILLWHYTPAATSLLDHAIHPRHPLDPSPNLPAPWPTPWPSGESTMSS